MVGIGRSIFGGGEEDGSGSGGIGREETIGKGEGMPLETTTGKE